MTEADISGIIRRVSFVVKDADASATLYEKLFGWTRFYDNETPVDGRFPPCAPDGTPARIIIMKADDPYIGMLGLMEYKGHTPDNKIDPQQEILGIGSSILVIETKDIESVYKRAQGLDLRLVSVPIDWSVTDYSGKGVIKLVTFSFFDGNGLYVEVNSRRN